MPTYSGSCRAGSGGARAQCAAHNLAYKGCPESNPPLTSPYSTYEPATRRILPSRPLLHARSMRSWHGWQRRSSPRAVPGRSVAPASRSPTALWCPSSCGWCAACILLRASPESQTAQWCLFVLRLVSMTTAALLLRQGWCAAVRPWHQIKKKPPALPDRRSRDSHSITTPDSTQPILKHYRGYAPPAAAAPLLAAYADAAQAHPAVAPTVRHPAGRDYWKALVAAYSKYADGSAQSKLAQGIQADAKPKAAAGKG